MQIDKLANIQTDRDKQINTDKLSIKQRWMQIDKLANIQTEIETDRKIVI